MDDPFALRASVELRSVNASDDIEHRRSADGKHRPHRRDCREKIQRWIRATYGETPVIKASEAAKALRKTNQRKFDDYLARIGALPSP